MILKIAESTSAVTDPSAEKTDIPDTAERVRSDQWEKNLVMLGADRPPWSTTMMQQQPGSVTDDNEVCLDQWTVNVLRRRVDQ